MLGYAWRGQNRAGGSDLGQRALMNADTPGAGYAVASDPGAVTGFDIALSRNAGGTTVNLTATQLAEVVGVPRATNAQAREVGRVCRDVLGRPKRIRGIDKWPVPMSRQSANLYEDLTDQDNF